MLLSMTGFGEARRQQDGLAVWVEVRTINSRYLKLSIRASDGYGSLESRIESLVRKRIRRGTILVNVRVDRARAPEDYRINVGVLDSYRQQLQGFESRWNLSQPISPESLLLLPGVVSDDSTGSVDAGSDWPVIRETLETAIESLHQMRIEEGRVMAADLEANCRAMAAGLDEVERRAPLVVETYRARLRERLNKTLAEFDVTLDPADVLKEVGLFADRSDISEEIVRLRSHLEQFEATMQAAGSSGRKLEFLTQEMVREANTIGSKASDVEISQQVIEIKSALERIREMIQNVE
ncbi:MAG: YicC family protein [Planctomycetes bacterium RBG_16_64_12]|nr:MAG: YicC family protein [Planctomycetes bacterium RBG_16_64_12]